MEINFSKDEKVTLIDKNVRFPKAQPIFSLEYLVKVETGEVDWSSVNSSWVISRELNGRRVLIAVRNKNIFKNYGKAGTMEPIDADFDVELEAVEIGEKTVCIDVMSVYGISVQEKNLAQRLSCITQQMASLLNIECQQFFAYDERTIDMVNEARVVNFVIQNSLDVYKTQRKRFTRITVDDKFNEEDYMVETKMQYESTYEVQDVIEVRSLFHKDIEGGQHHTDVVPDVVLVNYKKNGLLGQSKPQEYVVPRKVHELYMTLNKGISKKHKKNK